jgi:CheY-like chemotaxis protein
LLAYSRRAVLRPRRFDLGQLVNEMAPTLQSVAGEDIEVRVVLDQAARTVHADPHQMEQVVVHLATNARDAMPRGGRLLIEVTGTEVLPAFAQSHAGASAGRFVMLSVTDDGVGMDEEIFRNIFEPFFTTKDVGEGTGLGLPMVYGTVRQSGGFMDVQSAPGEGTVVRIYLPSAEPEIRDDSTSSCSSAPVRKRTVLVVEDEPGVLEYAAAVLEAGGYSVVKAKGKEDALELFHRQRGPVDLVLTDVVMPRGSGRELANELMSAQPALKVLYMSGHTGDVVLHHQVSAEGLEFIQKPFSPKELIAKIRSILG